eukprot:CAMPEP_0172300466 /NCGR_PEP_ID=MMETSP1058-20130122/2550_1 /TAXON_ID=83371 /ORGANISM="Detonula confervacea, Strain CCMP 353" /LENGTH=80 /DNA_ID=CAMNT_0013010245 /DNA_START=32 /DNA_END=270 /DNA_ORIENTATION=-
MVQRMEDNGTVNMKKEPAATAAATVLDLDTEATNDDDNTKYGSFLKRLIHSREEDAVAANSAATANNNNSNYGSLKRLLR